MRGRDKRVFLFDFVFFFCLVSGSDIPPFSLLLRFVLAESGEELKELFRVALTLLLVLRGCDGAQFRL